MRMMAALYRASHKWSLKIKELWTAENTRLACCSCSPCVFLVTMLYKLDFSSIQPIEFIEY